MSAYATLQMLLPLLAFALASVWGRPRQFEKIGLQKDLT
jgi:putative thiamine transport system permease protein